MINTKTLINFNGLYGDNHYPLLPDFIHYESLEIRSKMYDWEINEHLHTNLFQIFIIESGSGILVSEQQEINFEAPCLILIPTNTLHGFVFQPNIIGEVLTFSESFLESLFKNSPKILLEINHLNLISFGGNAVIFEQILQYKILIIKDLYEDNIEKQAVIQALFQLFFINIYRFSLSLKSLISVSNNRTLGYFQAFQKSIKRSLQETKSINEYAQELNITAVHLNRICQSLVQKSALQLVQEFLISEAKKYLLNTNYSISEVSYLLNFKDPAYFTRLFKKQTGVSPSEFKK
jgi:AraC family transcriptional activator of pobA